MSDYKVTPEELATAAASCDSTAGDVAARLATLKAYVVGLEASWQGVAATTFQGLMQEYDVYSTMLHDALTDIASGLRGTQINYGDAEKTNVNTITQIQNNLSHANLT
ncbi:WXG100 family type VII secretion target [Streptomyces sp. DvalAA-14]|uniref:WXG100 family type VII secretion target n=1 Tax=unclassified Streptomyces TaxID=2593676 RepID=UPI00081B61FF|nr:MULTISPECIES: WXG100 family type VII secretion target [unclassified Streptomyces]MYS19076.1 WXG100 family type VII secretion target [Streptomyces sp. SID4948]SCD36088.1 WXG100 family type VII secretion target [Streptomyces sp. DvalAA-14]